MATIVTWLIVVIIAVMLLFGVFKAARVAAVPIAILVVIVLTIALIRAFFTKENLNKLHDTVEQTGIGAAVEQGLTGSVGKRSSADGKAAGSEGVATVAEKPVEKAAQAPVEKANPGGAQSSVLATPEAVSVAAPAVPEPVAIDYSKYDKGKKSFKYALPFDATVNMSFKQGGYRFVVESLGKLSANDKKEIGQLMLQSLAKYRGESSSAVDKTKVSIDVKYDVEGNRTRVFIVVPLDAVE